MPTSAEIRARLEITQANYNQSDLSWRDLYDHGVKGVERNLPADLAWLLAEHDRLMKIAEQHSRLCLAEDATEDAVWPCGCRAQITDSHGSRKLIGEPCDLHERLQAIVLAARAWKDAKEKVEALRRFTAKTSLPQVIERNRFRKRARAAEANLLSALSSSSPGTGVVNG